MYYLSFSPLIAGRYRWHTTINHHSTVASRQFAIVITIRILLPIVFAIAMIVLGIPLLHSRHRALLSQGVLPMQSNCCQRIILECCVVHNLGKLLRLLHSIISPSSFSPFQSTHSHQQHSRDQSPARRPIGREHRRSSLVRLLPPPSFLPRLFVLRIRQRLRHLREAPECRHLLSRLLFSRHLQSCILPPPFEPSPSVRTSLQHSLSTKS